jgi:hypothetical protein
MKLPLTPPKTGDDASSKFWRELEARMLPFEADYLHWEEINQIHSPVQSVNHKQWWQLLKAKRRARLQSLPFATAQFPFYWVLDDGLLKKLTLIDRGFAHQFRIGDPRFLYGFASEAIASSQLSGIQISTEVAEDFLYSGRPAESENEMIILNHLKALEFVGEHRNNNLSEEMLLKICAEINTPHPNPPPQAGEGTNKEIIQAIIEFANRNESALLGFMHPLLKAMTLHFMMIHYRPFESGNERIGRILFYWTLLKSGYDLMEYFSISSVILKNIEACHRAFLYVESDEGDLTYFFNQQLKIILEALENLMQKFKTLHHAQQSLSMLPNHEKLNPRQCAILEEMRRHPERQYRLATYKSRFKITYETSRTDLMRLSKLGFAKQWKEGKAFIYSAASKKLSNRCANGSPSL